MLSARRKSDGQIVSAYFSSKSQGPFSCIDCGDELILKTGHKRLNHFAHANPVACKFAAGESDLHRRCKLEIYKALKTEPNARDVMLEHPIGNVRADVYATINSARVAIEVQISSLSAETIMQRTIEYGREGIYVLWLLQWTPKLDVPRYAPRQWEKWLHAAYFGRVYYWIEGLKIATYKFEPYHQIVPRKTWYSERGKKMTGGGFVRQSRRYRTPERGRTLNLLRDFVPRERFWWEGGGIKVPDAKLFVEK